MVGRSVGQSVSQSVKRNFKKFVERFGSLEGVFGHGNTKPTLSSRCFEGSEAGFYVRDQDFSDQKYHPTCYHYCTDYVRAFNAHKMEKQLITQNYENSKHIVYRIKPSDLLKVGSCGVSGFHLFSKNNETWGKEKGFFKISGDKKLLAINSFYCSLVMPTYLGVTVIHHFFLTHVSLAM